MEEKPTRIEAVFGSIWSQPLHKTLREYRVITVVFLMASMHIMYRLLDVIEEANRLSEGQQIAAVVGLATALITAIWKGIANLAEAHHDDFKN